MAVRNFWLSAEIDGRETTLAGGPRAKNGGMTVELYQRDGERIKKAITLICREKGDGKLVTHVYAHNGLDLVTQFVTDR